MRSIFIHLTTTTIFKLLKSFLYLFFGILEIEMMYLMHFEIHGREKNRELDPLMKTMAVEARGN